MTPRKKLFGERLAQRRKQLGLSQRELAKRVGIRGPSLAEYETDDTWPSVPTLIALAEALDTSVDYLLGLSDHPKPCDAEP
jgi:transcriptional regulator with XRE-family HTH domain